MSATYESFKGKIILVAEINANPGKGDELAKYITAISAFSNSPQEPGCLTFRVVRFEDKFIVFEEYVNKAAVDEHFKGTQYNALRGVAEELIAGGRPQLQFFEELPPASA